MFNRFTNRSLQTLKEALPRTVAPLTAAACAKSTFSAGCLLAAFTGTFAMDDPKASTASVVATLGTFVGLTTLAGAAAGYLGGYGGSYLLMAAFPKLQSVQTRCLLGPGRAGQIGLFSASLAIPVAKACVNALINAKSEPPKMKGP